MLPQKALLRALYQTFPQFSLYDSKIFPQNTANLCKTFSLSLLVGAPNGKIASIKSSPEQLYQHKHLASHS